MTFPSWRFTALAALLLTASLASGGCDTDHEEDAITATPVPVPAFGAPADVVEPDPRDFSEVGLSRETPTAAELVDQDAKALEEKHAAEPALDGEAPQSRVWFHHTLGRVSV